MRSWSTVEVPRLPGEPAPLRLYDTASRTVRPAMPDGSEAGIYVCGITPYDSTHLGHAATYVAFDLVQRVWRDHGLTVHYVQNVTDIDDPLLERATATGEDWQHLAEREVDRYREDMAALRVLPPRDFVGAVESIPDLVPVIAKLLAVGAAYRVEADIYFDVTSDADFGSVAGLDDTTMRALFAERGGDPDRPGKRHPLDSLLWRGERPGEPAWPSELGPGRPGWHIECAVIAARNLGMGFLVQGGGSDLAFPHHEHSASHARVATGTPVFAQRYVHAGMIGLDGEKMSKSRGNLVFVSRLRGAGVDPMAIRLALLDGHYRADREWSGGRLRAAEARLASWRRAVAQPAAPDAVTTVTAVRSTLADDLDTSAALAAVDAWAAATNDASARHSAAESTSGQELAGAVDALLGVAL